MTVMHRFAEWFGKDEGAAPAGDPDTQSRGNEMFHSIKLRDDDQRGLDIPDPPKTSEFRKMLRWWINEAPDKSVTMDVTPAHASEMLAYNDRNRPVSKARLNGYAAQMKGGAWRYTRVPIIFSDNGRLIDGQHRLMACVESGVSFRTDIVFGAPDDSFYYIDVGCTRTASDIFAINGVVNHTMAAAATRLLMAYDAGSNGGDYGLGSTAPNLQQVYDAFCGYPNLQESVRVGISFARDRLPNPSAAAAIHYICARKARKTADEYFDKIASGINFSSRRDPAYKVRDYIARADGQRLTRREVVSALIQGWNALRTNKPLGTIKTEKIGRAV